MDTPASISRAPRERGPGPSGVGLGDRSLEEGRSDRQRGRHTREDARIEGVEARIELVTGDMRELPFVAGAFDVIRWSWAIHGMHELSITLTVSLPWFATARSGRPSPFRSATATA